MEIKNIIDEYNSKIAEIQSGLTETLKKSFKTIFEECPNLYMISWVQYAPYFNDGDPCEFNVHEIYPVNKKIREDEEFVEDDLPTPWRFDDDFRQYTMSEPSDWLIKQYPSDASVVAWQNSSEEYKKEVEKVNSLLGALASIPDDIFKAAFGEDNAVYVFKDKIVTEDFSGNHD